MSSNPCSGENKGSMEKQRSFVYILENCTKADKNVLKKWLQGTGMFLKLSPKTKIWSSDPFLGKHVSIKFLDARLCAYLRFCVVQS